MISTLGLKQPVGSCVPFLGLRSIGRRRLSEVCADLTIERTPCSIRYHYGHTTLDAERCPGRREPACTVGDEKYPKAAR